MNNFHKELPKLTDEYLKNNPRKINSNKIAKSIVRENAAFIRGLDSGLAKSILNAERGISPKIDNMKNYIRADVKATLLSHAELRKMNKQAPRIAANLKAVPGYKGGFSTKAATKALKGWSVIALAIDVVSTVSKTTDAVGDGRYADATKEALGGSLSIVVGALAGLAIGKFVLLGVACGPVGWVAVAAGAAAVGFAAGETGKAIGEWASGHVNNKFDIENIPQGGSK